MGNEHIEHTQKESRAFTRNKITKIHPRVLQFANQKHYEVILKAPKEKEVCEFYRTKYLLENNQFHPLGWSTVVTVRCLVV